MYPTNEICHLWAHGLGTEEDPERHIRNPQGNLYAHGNELFSYGSHYPLGLRIPTRDGVTVYLLNPRSYSVTTSKHQGAARSAIPGGPESVVVWLPVDFWSSVKDRRSGLELRKFFTAEIQQTLAPAHNTRCSYYKRNAALEKSRSLRRIWEALSRAMRFRVRSPIPVFPEPDPADLEAVRVRDAERQAVRDEKRKAKWAAWQAAEPERAAAYAKQKEERKAEAERLAKQVWIDLPLWKCGELETLRGAHLLGFDALRIRAGVVESSGGARVPLEACLSFFRNTLQTVIACKGERFSEIQLGAYRGVTATDKGLKVGCHLFPWKEVRGFAVAAGVNPDTLAAVLA